MITLNSRSAPLKFSIQHKSEILSKLASQTFLFKVRTQLSFQPSEGHLSIIGAVLDSNPPTDHLGWDDFLIGDLVCSRGSSSGLKSPSSSSTSSSSSSSSSERGEARCRALTVILMSQ